MYTYTSSMYTYVYFVRIKKMLDLPSSWEFFGGYHTGLFRIPRVAWISGSEPPPAVSTPVTRLESLACPSARLLAVYLYSAHLWGWPMLLW